MTSKFVVIFCPDQILQSYFGPSGQNNYDGTKCYTTRPPGLKLIHIILNLHGHGVCVA